ncbi:uncharacterized protein LOC111263191 isoform X2 [Varroa jacobsoni]|uniref:GDT1 family protein n=1 Tax=Varroa destructor TaxID=109461 RepID=A0A7M7JQ08_VARDE|nr:uncharacterized protein LOC111247890 isoform X2 [Varroa destructor]XP_022693819.1 uncharacterized protein LOC111263191 isoform X2 [Varroa jacobsoni]
MRGNSTKCKYRVQSLVISTDSTSENGTKITQQYRTTNGSANKVWPSIKKKLSAIHSMRALGNQTHRISKVSAFADAFGSSLVMTVLSELGDKTFFITAILAARHSRCVIYWGAMAALALMTLTATGLGYAIQFVPTYIVHYSSICLFILFGLHMLYEGVMKCRGNDSESEEGDMKQDTGSPPWYKSPFAKTFILVLFAEWGDRSQIATIGLSATKLTYGVFVGALLAHAVCTLIAALAGQVLDKFIPVAALTIAGGFVFLAFAAYSLATGYLNNT